jgi:CheY-like chemotaxis protein
VTGEFNQRKVLLVDDVAFFRDVMRDYFRRTPVTLLFAENGKEAVETAAREQPSLIFMDVAMPVMSGIEACAKIKANAQLSGIPILLIFTPDRDAREDEVRASGCDDSLRKPFGREEFLNLGHRYLFHLERRERRVACQMSVDFSIAGRSYLGRGIDISMNGLYIECREEIPPHKIVELSFLLPTVSPQRVCARGKITWLNQGFPRKNLNLPQGFGVEIVSIDAQSVDIIKRYLDRN